MESWGGDHKSIHVDRWEENGLGTKARGGDQKGKGWGPERQEVGTRKARDGDLEATTAVEAPIPNCVC